MGAIGRPRGRRLDGIGHVGDLRQVGSIGVHDVDVAVLIASAGECNFAVFGAVVGARRPTFEIGELFERGVGGAVVDVDVIALR